MTENKYFEENKPTTFGGICAFDAYEHSKARNTDIIEADDLMFDDCVADFVDTLRNAGVREFVVTTRTTNLADIASLLEFNGCALRGVATVTRQNDMNGNPFKHVVNGFKFIVC